MMKNRIMAELTSTPWLIMPSWLQAITNVATGKEILSEISSPMVIEQITQRQEALSKQTGSARQNEMLTEQRDSVAILNLHGPIIRFGGMLEISGYTSTQTAMREFVKLENDPSVKTIVLHSNGPGGQAHSIDQFANMIRKSSKKTIGYVDSLTASAHYWIISACDEIVASSTSMIGSIGAVYSLMDDSKKKKKEGLQEIEIVSSVSPNKRPDITTEKGQAQIQKWADQLGAKFVEAVATHRGVSIETVKDRFGKGDLLISDEALEVGMISRIQDFEELMEDFKTGKTKSISTKTQGASMNVEELQAQFPETYNTIYESGVSAGVGQETERIQAIENIIPAGLQNVESITALKFDGNSTASDVKAALFDYEQEAKTKALKNVTTDAQDVAAQVAAVETAVSPESAESSDDAVSVAADAAIEEINKKRG